MQGSAQARGARQGERHRCSSSSRRRRRERAQPRSQQMLDGVTRAAAAARRARRRRRRRERASSSRRTATCSSPLADLEKARDALKHRIDAGEARGEPALHRSRATTTRRGRRRRTSSSSTTCARRRKEAEAQARPADERLARTARPRCSRSRSRSARPTPSAASELLDATLDACARKVIAAHPGVKIGFTGGAVTALAEHDAISKGMRAVEPRHRAARRRSCSRCTSAARRCSCCSSARSAIATAAAFGAAALTVGHLNAATAFLGAIIAGNGINYGILLIARYLEERRRHDVDDAIAAAIVGTLRPTAVASLGASIAYGSLAATQLQGLRRLRRDRRDRHDAVLDRDYTLLPALMLRFGRAHAHLPRRSARRLDARRACSASAARARSSAVARVARASLAS